MPSRRRLYRSTRRGQRRRNRVHYHKVVNFTSSMFKYNATSGNWVRTTYGPQLAGGTDLGSGINAGAGYFLAWDFVDIQNNTSPDQQAEISCLNRLFSKRQLAGVRVSLLPRVNEVFSTTADPVKQDTSGRRNVNECFYTVPYYDDISNIAGPSTDVNFSRAHTDMPGAHSHPMFRGGHHYIKPRAPRVSIANNPVGNTANAVIIGSQRAPWISTISDNTAVGTNQIRHNGLLIFFPPCDILFQYDLKITYYIKYKSHY